MRTSTYDKRPLVMVGSAADAVAGKDAVSSALRGLLAEARVLVLESYPGVRPGDLAALLEADLVVDVSSAYLSPAELDELVATDLTDDPLFGRLSVLGVEPSSTQIGWHCFDRG